MFGISKHECVQKKRISCSTNSMQQELAFEVKTNDALIRAKRFRSFFFSFSSMSSSFCCTFFMSTEAVCREDNKEDRSAFLLLRCVI